MPNITFGYPLALYLLLLLPIVYLLARFGVRSATTRVVLRRRNRRLSMVLRLSIVTLLVLSIADIQLVTQSDKLATVFLLDSSDSVGAGGKRQGVQFIRDASNKMKDNQEMGVVVFGQDALIEKLVGKDKKFDNPTSSPGTNYTNLAEAIRLGSSMLPSDAQRRLVLISDGNQNLDEVRSAAKLASANGIQVDVVALDQLGGQDMALAAINVPNNLREGEQFNLNVTVESNYEGGAKLIISQQGQVVSEAQVDVKKGNNTYTQALKASSRGFLNYSARIIPNTKDTVEQNNEASAYSLVKGKPRILMVDGHPEQKEAANLETALKAADIESTTITADKFPGLTDLAQYDSLILVDVPASNLSQKSMDTIQAYVKSLGKGMVMVGGEESYGLGGYFRTPIEEMLPVELQLPNKLQTPSVAMVMVIDRSGSMADAYNGPGAGASGIPKIEIAKDAAYLAATQLNNSDQVGVVTFDTSAQWVVNLAPMGNPSNLVSAIGRIAPGGGTQISSGLGPAIEALKGVTAQNKHIILLTDGVDSDNISYDTLIADANKSGITVSSVGLGEDVDEKKLKSIADRAGGRYWFVNDPSNLPKVFTKESRLAYRSYIIEEPFVPTINAPSPILRGITATPKLLGYVGTKARPLATTALVSDRGDPLLAHWQSGLGRVVAWTSDAKSRWASDWLKWNDFPKFWAQTVRWTIAENDTGGLQISTKTVGNKVIISADALTTDSQYVNSLEAKATIVNSNLNGSVDEVTLQQVAPGRYEGSFVPKNTGSYIVNVQAGEGASGTATVGNGAAAKVGNLTQTVGAVASYSPEYKQLGTNKALLAEVASLTGGRVLTNPEDAFSDDLTRTTRSNPLWPWLLALLLLLFPLDIGVRRVNLSFRSLTQGFKNRNQPMAESSPEDEAVSEEVSRLFEAKERVASRSRVSVEEAPKAGKVMTGTGLMDAPSILKAKPSNSASSLVGLPLSQMQEATPAVEKAEKVRPVEVEEETSYTSVVRKFNKAAPVKTEEKAESEKAPTNAAAPKPVAPTPEPIINPPPRPRPAPAKVTPSTEEEEGIGRLLKAKQRAHEERTKKSDE